MKILDIFKSKSTREREARRERRHAFRNAENAIDSVRDRQKELEKEAKKRWAEAREALKNGEKAAAQRALVSYRAAQAMAVKLEQKRWVFEQYVTKMQVAGSDAQFASALAAVNKVMAIDPETVEDVFADAQEKLGESVGGDKFWERLYGKEMEGAVGTAEDHIPSLDDMNAQLEQEVAAEVGGGSSAAATANQEIDSRIAAGQERVKNMLEGK